MNNPIDNIPATDEDGPDAASLRSFYDQMVGNDGASSAVEQAPVGEVHSSFSDSEGLNATSPLITVVILTGDDQPAGSSELNNDWYLRYDGQADDTVWSDQSLGALESFADAMTTLFGFQVVLRRHPNLIVDGSTALGSLPVWEEAQA